MAMTRVVIMHKLRALVPKQKHLVHLKPQTSPTLSTPAAAVKKKIRGLVTGFEACEAACCRNQSLLHIMCGYQCDKAVNKNDTREVI